MFEPPGCTALVLRELGAAPDPLAAFERLRGGHAPWLLDSALRSERLGRWSFVGADPYLVVRARGPRVSIECRRSVYAGLRTGSRFLRAPVLETLRRLQPALPIAPEDAPPFVGGAVGVFGYELALQLDAHTLQARDDLGLPDATWLFVDRVLAIDHQRDRAYAVGLGFAPSAAHAQRRAEAAVASLVSDLEKPAPRPRALVRGPRVRRPRGGQRFDASAYAKGVDALLQDIAAGDLYQGCLTSRMVRPFEGDPFDLYRALRRGNPAPFAAYLELPELAVVGSSPERFLRVWPDGRVESRPIKGTAPRGRHPGEDAAHRLALARSEKDHAENLMIVDLVRNDFGRVCRAGSIEAPELMAIEDYPSVFQLVSTVRGRLRDDADTFDLVRACFPPGSMTGAPKIAAMRRVDRLEPVRRAFYSGALGYLDVRGGADLSVVIRTALVQNGRAILHAGGGIVADSEPGAEVDEAMAKLRPLLAALDACSAEAEPSARRRP